MKDVLIFLLLMLLAFPFGAGFAAFLRWLSKRKREARSQQAVANSWVYLCTWGVVYNVFSGAIYAWQHNRNQIEDHLIQAAFFFVAFFGARAETRRFQRRH